MLGYEGSLVKVGIMTGEPGVLPGQEKERETDWERRREVGSL